MFCLEEHRSFFVKINEFFAVFCKRKLVLPGYKHIDLLISTKKA